MKKKTPVVEDVLNESSELADKSFMDLLTADTSPALRFVGEIEFKRCHECGGVGHVPCPQTVAVRTIGLNSVPALQPSTGHPIPCPSCNGAKVVANF